jgi:hypothetical protein
MANAVLIGRCLWCGQHVAGTAIRPRTITLDGRAYWIEIPKDASDPACVIEISEDADGDRFPAQPERFDVAA